MRIKWNTNNPPDYEEEYLVQLNSGEFAICRWTNINHFWTDLTTNWHWHIIDVPQYTKVVAWMLLPEHYKE